MDQLQWMGRNRMLIQTTKIKQHPQENINETTGEVSKLTWYEGIIANFLGAIMALWSPDTTNMAHKDSESPHRLGCFGLHTNVF